MNYKADSGFCFVRVMSKLSPVREAPLAVKVNSRHQISLPLARLGVNWELRRRPALVDVQDGILILIPQPDDLVAHMAGLHRDVWSSTDTDAYLRESATHGRIHLPTRSP
ncbi:MAG: hypothetical protein R2838_09185 [Caldilineaceae bacterium]